MLAALPLPALIALFALAAAVIFLSGLWMTGLADRLADRTGLGEALVGGVLLGAATSMSGTLVSLTAALDGRASLAFSNGIGGIAAQTAFLAVADIVHRRANLEHAAAELANVFQGALLMLLLALPLLALTGPEATLLGVHPVSVLLVVVYGGGLVAVRRVRETPMWRPVRTPETEPDVPDEDGTDRRATLVLFGRFALLLLLLGAAGWLLSQVAAALIDRYALRASLVGALMTAVATSLPELVTTIAAVRRGALQLALGGIIGGNTFDVLFLTLADIGYREGSIYHAVGMGDWFWLAVGLVMTAVLTLGMLYREKQGPANIGVESVALLLIYGGAILLQVLA
ncbi:sodium:calcium antiporter [Rhodobacteraceae bacterium 2CG4]|uniref:Sodium:calcium antiporter n=1 Tax=Halovulum marinum TaxID=2662447 RepID=A0A6L5Z4U0_9RHOB|nr:sodium:calcium antiporter [Halovulum marinum]MSU91329.1 sodium:calcium antiporter [Halovulum marinum]